MTDRPPRGLVVFDFDGTLVDSTAIKHQGYYAALEDCPSALRLLEEILASPPGDRYAVFRLLARRLANETAIDAELLARKWAARYTEFCERGIAVAPEIGGAASACSTLLANGFSLYINSATPEVDLRVIVNRRGMSHWFDGVYGGPCNKIENLSRILTATGVLPAQCVVVGDGRDDYAAAKQCNCAFLPVNQVGAPQDLYGLPDQITASLSEAIQRR